MSAYRPIEDYAAIGNLRSVALVSKDGSIDWAPAPFVDSPSIFAALLDKEHGGSWQIAPRGEFSSTQTYCKDTNVLETSFRKKGGELLLTDHMPLEKDKAFVPAEKNMSFRIVRRVECIKGECSVRMSCRPRFDYGRGKTSLTAIDEGVRFAGEKGMCATLVSGKKIEIQKDEASAIFDLEEGDVAFFVLRYNGGNVWHEAELSNEEYESELEETKVAWRTWAHACDLDVCPVLEGPWEDAIRRSLLVLRLLFFEPSGTVAAAPTTSLPEEVGGVRNWDYRFTWLRDAAFTFQAFFRLGHFHEAKEYLHWILSECRQGDISKLQILYPLYGNRILEEEWLPHLEGYQGSKPVRIGNNAYLQSQWDIYGSVLGMLWELHEGVGNAVTIEDWPIIKAIADYVTTIWEKPDEGLWEVRAGKDHFVYSKVMCFVALDRACKLAEAYNYEVSTEWEKALGAIQDAVFSRGWSKKVGTFVQRFDGTELDTALLRLPLVGFIEGDDPRMIATIDAIRTHLYSADGLLYRYTTDDGLPGQEGAFLLSSFWLVDALAVSGKTGEAKELFNKLLTFANHVGLYSEEVDPGSRRFLGNFPQAYTHIGLINSALLLTELENKKP